jgi:hypothetical protein
MGTNVYLLHDVCEHCDRPAARIHIGKSSGGWRWLWRGYRGWEAEDLPFGRPILSGDDWWGVLDASVNAESRPGWIVDEYGKRMSLADLRNWVEQKRDAANRRGDGGFDTYPDGDDDISFREFS